MDWGALVGQLAAGLWFVASFLIVLGPIMFVHELGHFIFAKLAGVRVEEFGFGFPPRLLRLFRRGETDYTLNLLPIGAFVRMAGEEDPSDPRSLAAQPKGWRITVLAAGPAMNFVAAVLVLTLAFVTGWPITRVVIGEVAPGTPAEMGGLQPFDAVLAVDGEPIASADALITATHQSLGKEIALSIGRAGRLLQVGNTPFLLVPALHEKAVKLTATPRTEWPVDQGPLGITIYEMDDPSRLVQHPPLSALGHGVSRTGDVFRFFLAVPGMLLRGTLSLQDVRPIGPLNMTRIATYAVKESVQTRVFYPVFQLAALVSIGLGLTNLLPIPALDGGRILFVLVELLRGRRIEPEREHLVHLIGFAILLALMGAILVQDILNPIGPSPF